MELPKSVLESEYIKQSRPYSQNELKYLRDNLYRNLRLCNKILRHTKCRHFYYVKENSRKDKEMIEKNKCENVGNCSVCWKLNKTRESLIDKAEYLVEMYCSSFYKEPEKYTYDLLDLETVFYKWLYYENEGYNDNSNMKKKE
jgi:hypothetical protein